MKENNIPSIVDILSSVSFVIEYTLKFICLTVALTSCNGLAMLIVSLHPILPIVGVVMMFCAVLWATGIMFVQDWKDSCTPKRKKRGKP